MNKNPSISSQPVVYVVDDDQAVRESLVWLIESVGLKVESFPSAQVFLNHYQNNTPGCLLLDVRMPGLSGLELQDHLRERGMPLPIIFITGHGDVPMAVKAMKHGAVDFIEKPFNDQRLLDTLQKAIRDNLLTWEQKQESVNLIARWNDLSNREREVLDLVVLGKVNKQIADILQISIKTVEGHRASVMRKMNARTVADLVRMVLEIREMRESSS
ncbi:MAG: response regulator transcription factor [Magnetococcales bacterium]|nr:response regulator transcription factor [Magnetococcales bacterium]NGZ25854.1 response regulator transcription factor [Magnetococcales bacterium]